MTIQQPTKVKGKAVHQLIKQTGGLDLNSVYYYYILCDFYRQTSAIAINEKEEVVGYLSALVAPNDENSLFVWQVAVHPSAQGKGLSKQMLEFVIQKNPHLSAIKTTIGPDNMASQGLFKSIAKKHNAKIYQETYLSSEDLGDHDPEILFTIKPINQ